jgi:DNA-binding SARP family transcriptional activator
MIYLLRPETRPALDDCRFGRALTIARDAGVALAGVRERGETSAAGALPWDEEACLRAHVLPVHLCELALAASLAHTAAADSVLQRIPHLRRCLHRVATVSSPIVAEAAAARLRTLPHRSAHRLSVSALGALRLVRDGTPVDDPAWERRARVRELMAALVEERRISRESVAVRCWPDLDVDRALRNLRVTLTYLGRVLDPSRPTDAEPTVIRSVGDLLVLDDEVDVDVDRFDRLLARALDHDRAGSPSTALEGYREALALYRGDYLAGIDADWVTPMRTRYQLAALSAMLRAGELELASGEPDRAASWATRALAISPGNERAGRLHASCLAALGDRVAAARALRGLVAVLAAERLEPELETQRLLQRIEGTSESAQ